MVKSTAKPVWSKPRPKALGGSKALPPAKKASAKRAAKAAGRPYPNLVDNMRAAARKKQRGGLARIKEATCGYC